MRKPYAELTEAGKAKRLAKYEKENAAERQKLEAAYAKKNGKTIELVDCLATLVRAPKIKENQNGSKTAVMRLAIYNAEAKKTEFVTGTMYLYEGTRTVVVNGQKIEKTSEDLEAFIASLEKGNLLSIRYAKTPGQEIVNVWSIFKRERKQKEEA